MDIVTSDNTTTHRSLDAYQKAVSMEDLPNEILLRIFSYLSAGDLLSCINVSRSWEYIASDGFLWQTKLCHLFGNRWFVVGCEEKPKEIPDFSDLNVIHPSQIYVFLSKYVPVHMLDDHQTLTMHSMENILPVAGALQSARQSLKEAISKWWNRFIHRLSINISRQQNRTTGSLYRFAVFGPGFDQRATNRLFSKLVDTRTKSFEPVNMIPGRMGFGAGLTLRLYAQAQLAAYDSSIQTQMKQQSLSKKSAGENSATSCYKTSPRLGNRISTRKVLTLPETSNQTVSTNASTQSGSDTLLHLHEDFVFDLHYIYSLRGHLSQRFKTQLERILSSRIFRHPSSDDPMTDMEVLESLSVTDNMSNILRTLNGIIYALDARDDMKESACLYNELRAVLRGLPEDIAKRIPIFILYIMPKEDINFKPFAPQVRKNSLSNLNNVELPNRDSYSGANYTVSWRGSLLLPISGLRLFELENPWRLQKCASNDIKAVIQGIMWLRERAPSLLAISASFALTN
ncbi:hypothetical protein CRM22_009214 [Opisthorchis felineus]|uniref:F-box domain-containing protein n=1 Tax=Opisthorchis felineus TaxID=147828 RepID=A0A4S2LFN5_OPIFE|nr:hypothetical protein CRM22_009214 [Opisthorchis felineus]